MRRANSDAVQPGADAAVEAAGASTGSPLPAPARARFEQSLGADLSAVRVHTGPESAAAADAVGARAYAVGNDIHFGAGQYAPSDPWGQHLLAHEVAHTQQQAGAAPARQHKLEITTTGDPAEHEADRAADAMVRGAPTRVTGAPTRIARQQPPAGGAAAPPGPIRVWPTTLVTMRDVPGEGAITRGDVHLSGDVEVATMRSTSDGNVSQSSENAATEIARRHARSRWSEEEKRYPVDAIDFEWEEALESPFADGRRSSHSKIACRLHNGAVARGTLDLRRRDGGGTGFDFDVGPVTFEHHSDLPKFQDENFEGATLSGHLQAAVKGRVDVDQARLRQRLEAAVAGGIAGKDREPEFEARGNAAIASLGAGGPTAAPTTGGGNAPAGTAAGLPAWFGVLQKRLLTTPRWGEVEEQAQHVLRDYALWRMSQRPSGSTPSIATMFGYLGRSDANSNAATAKGRRGTAHYGGGPGSSNWCTSASTTAVTDGLHQLGYAPITSMEDVLDTLRKIKGVQSKLWAGSAYAASLMPGDVVMFLFDGCQYGGHTATVVEDNGDSFTHVSGNAGSQGVGMSVSRRTKTPPPGFSLDHANNHGCGPNTFGGVSLIYSIQRYGMVFAELAALTTIDPDVDPDAEAALLARFHLKKR